MPPSSNTHAPVFSIAFLGLVLCAAGLYALPHLTKPEKRRGAIQLVGTVDQARAKLLAHYPPGQFGGLDNEVLRQVVFGGQGRPARSGQPLWVRTADGGISMSAFPVEDGRRFALVLDHAGEFECRAMALTPSFDADINGRPGGQPADCRKTGNMVRTIFPAREQAP